MSKKQFSKSSIFRARKFPSAQINDKFLLHAANAGSNEAFPATELRISTTTPIERKSAQLVEKMCPSTNFIPVMTVE